MFHSLSTKDRRDAWWTCSGCRVAACQIDDWFAKCKDVASEASGSEAPGSLKYFDLHDKYINNFIIKQWKIRNNQCSYKSSILSLLWIKNNRMAPCCPRQVYDSTCWRAGVVLFPAERLRFPGDSGFPGRIGWTNSPAFVPNLGWLGNGGVLISSIVYLSIYLSIFLSIHLSICLSIYLSIHLSIYIEI